MLDHEDLISLAKAAAWISDRTGDPPLHVSTLHRWAIRGCRGVKLETVAAGHARYTSIPAIQRFFNAKPVGPAPATAVVIQPSARGVAVTLDTSTDELRGRIFREHRKPTGGAA